MKIDKETEASIQELQILEQNMQNLILQKQAFQLENDETAIALEELGKSKDEAYKIIGQIMLKSDRDELKKELEEKQKILNLRLKSLEKQEELFSNKLSLLREEIQRKIK